MSVNPPLREVLRQSWPKPQPRAKRAKKTKPAAPEGFSKEAKAIIEARSGGVCELDACGRAEVIHHRRPRGAGGTSLPWVNKAANGLHVTNACHLRAEGVATGSSRHQSYVYGWLIHLTAHITADQVHALYRGEFVLLDDAGAVRPIGGEC